MQLRAGSTSSGLLRARYEVIADGRVVTGWTARTPQAHRELVVDGATYVLDAHGVARFSLEGGVRAHLRRTVDPRPRTSWTLEAGALAYRMTGSGLGRRFTLADVDGGTEVGAVWRTTGLRPSYGAELPDEVPVPVGVFVLWAAMAIWRATVTAAATAVR
ncbi:hypothetical protein [Pseudonocardia sp. TMWB2A]|uniref:hypothetical protein n=1 Tax=Pseudonocardia sp. TMWB2A TaxID=687430 RepID=UPI00307EE912